MSVLNLSKIESDIAVITFDDPDRGANVLSSSVLDELEPHLDALDEQPEVKGLIIASAKPGIFIAGADLREFVASLDVSDEVAEAMCRRGQTLFGRLCQSHYVTVAAIDGLTLGGGAELAIWCDRRIMTSNPKSQYGFPEVKLGLFPGWGGTARAPRIIGLGNAVEMVTGGASISAREAAVMGLVSDVVATDQLQAAAVNLIRNELSSKQYLEDRETWSGPIAISQTELGFLGVTASAVIRQETKGQYPAPEAALEVMLEGSMLDCESACQLEAQGMARLFGSPINAALLNVFFLTDRNKKDTGVDDANIQPQKIGKVGVLGAGIMGSGISAANVKRGMHLWLSDADDRALEAGLRNTLEEAAYDREKRRPSLEKMTKLSPQLNQITSDADWGTCDLVIEAIVENKDVKTEVYRRLEPQLGKHAILASNTSTIPITQLAEQLEHPERFIGIHFFNPVRRMQLVEVIRGEKTSDETVSTSVAYAKKLGKMPIVVQDGPGFLVNRLLTPYMNESLELLAEGVSIEDIDKAAKRFGMPMGPITLYDVVGLDTALFAGRTLWEAFPERINPSPILRLLVKEGRYGQKTGQGFFKYEKKKNRGIHDPELDALIEPLVRPRDHTPEEITMRLFLPMVVEATRLLEDGLVRDVRDIDLGMIFGVGFPPFKGGPMFWVDQVGADHIVEQLKPMESLGQRMVPTQLLSDLAKSHGKFYPDRN